jgi:hypothetical protein
MIELEPHESLIVDTRLFQRLRGIFQTGLTYLVYPCAVHSRFEHSLGCLHLAGRTVEKLERQADVAIDKVTRLTIRLAALLHDVSHCIFSHVSEPLYARDPKVIEVRKEIESLFHDDDETPEIGAAEAVTYSIITSEPFKKFLTEVRRVVGPDLFPEEVSADDIARLIVGLPPASHRDRLFVAQVVNGPFDVDKLDYQTRDGYFTGVTMPVDLERLLASLCVRNRGGQLVLAVDHRGITPIEQLLFNRMLLYDAVYHHHKIRAAHQLFSRAAQNEESLSLGWLVGHDEYDFFGGSHHPGMAKVIERLRSRDLPRRAVVVHPATVNASNAAEGQWRKRWAQYVNEEDPVDRQKAKEWFEQLERSIAEKLPTEQKLAFYLDIP